MTHKKMNPIKKFFVDVKKYLPYALRSAKAELQSEVAGSKLSWLWWVIEPLCFMLIYAFVFSVIFEAKEEFFPIFIVIGLACWEFFNRMVKGSVTLISSNYGLISRVYIPKYILLLAKSFTYLFKMFISLILTFVMMLCFQVPFSPLILFIFLIIPILYIISFGVGMILMHLGVYVEDLKNTTNIVLRLIFYLSGVFYNIKLRLGTNVLSFLLLRVNPIAFLMNEMRKVMLYQTWPSFEGLAIWAGIGIVLCVIGIVIINKNENTYARMM